MSDASISENEGRPTSVQKNELTRCPLPSVSVTKIGSSSSCHAKGTASPNHQPPEVREREGCNESVTTQCGRRGRNRSAGYRQRSGGAKGHSQPKPSSDKKQIQPKPYSGKSRTFQLRQSSNQPVVSAASQDSSLAVSCSDHSSSRKSQCHEREGPSSARPGTRALSSKKVELSSTSEQPGSVARAASQQHENQDKESSRSKAKTSTRARARARARTRGAKPDGNEKENLSQPSMEPKVKQPAFRSKNHISNSEGKQHWEVHTQKSYTSTSQQKSRFPCSSKRVGPDDTKEVITVLSKDKGKSDSRHQPMLIRTQKSSSSVAGPQDICVSASRDTGSSRVEKQVSYGEPTSVVIQLSPPLLDLLSKENLNIHFSKFLTSILDIQHFKPDQRSQRYSIRVVFSTVAYAKEAISALNGGFICGLYQMAMSLEPGSTHNTISQQRQLTNSDLTTHFLMSNVKKKKLTCEKETDEEVSKLRKFVKESTKRKKRTHIFDPKYAKVNAEIEIKSHLIKEFELRRNVFMWQLNQIEAKLVESLETLEPEDISKSLCARFNRECKRYDKGLPIFAYRQNIMEDIENNQVCVLVGETGSGKSTQLVQYLYEAGYASNGLIVCTQPRKLAAISLAEHVSKEVDENVGDTYGYLTTRDKQSKNTKVLFMTDHTLLNECIADPNLSKYSCLVIDEAHERSIHTDILIAFIKRCLPNRPDLKVIITSATIDPTVFSAYFHQCPIIRVPGRLYPVEVKWNQDAENDTQCLADRDYVTAAAELVYDIHVEAKKQKMKGDILVFLTCPAEIEKACKLARNLLRNEAEVLPLHGKLQPEEQRKVFEPTKAGKRKVVFSTNVAETSVTIPGIVYVIDTGLSKELCYDPQKNMNSLEIRPISKSSADQRKGRAGRTCPGECHRLFSKSDFANMRDNSVPEIMRITLAFAVIKLYEFGIEDIHSFEFVESPDRKALDEAVENLKFLGAIEKGKLTKLGRKMALLPLEPNLSKVVFDAVDRGIGTEAVVASAISTLSGRVFFRPESPESQEESERMRLPFCQDSGDQMTYLHTFFEWSHQNRRDQNKWCVANFVNAKSMRMVQETVKDLCSILKEKCRIYISPIDKIATLKKADKTLPKLFFYAFLRNICVHLGHNRVGYWSERLPDEQLAIHPGSSLCSLSSVPECVVYERTQKTSQHFLLQALPVREEWIQEAVMSNKLPCHPTERSWYYQVSNTGLLTFTNLGPGLLRKLQQTYPYDRRKIVPVFSAFEVRPVFEYSRDQGIFKVFAQVQYHDEIHGRITELIREYKDDLRDEVLECGLTSNFDDTKMTIGRGGCIQSILMPGDFHTVVVRGLTEEQFEDAEEELRSLGKCTSRQRGDQLFVNYEDPSDATKALAYRFTGIIPGPRVRVVNYREKYKNNFCLKVEWWRRQRLDYAYINFYDSEANPEDMFFDVLELLQTCGTKRDRKTGLEYSLVQREIKDDRSFSLRVRGIRDETTEEIVRASLISCLPISKNAEFEVHFLYEKAHEETDIAYHKERDNLDALLARHASRNSYFISFNWPYSDRATIYRAFVHFNDAIVCWKTFQSLRRVRRYRNWRERELEEGEILDDDDDDDDDVYSDSEDDISTSSSDASEDDGETSVVHEDTNCDGEDPDDSVSKDDNKISEDNSINGDDRESESDSISEEFCFSSDDDDEDDSSPAEMATDESQSVIRNGVYRIELSLSSSTRYTRQVFSVIKPSVEKISRKHLSKFTKINCSRTDRWGNVFVDVTTNDNRAFKRAQRALAKAVEPDIVPFSEDKENRYVATVNFQNFVKAIQETTSTYIQINSSSLTTSTIAVYGTRRNRERAKEEVKLHVETVLHGAIECFEVHLKNEKAGLMKHLVEKYGSDAAGITGTIEGITATKLIPRCQVLTLFATESGYQTFLQAITSFEQPTCVIQAMTHTTTELGSFNECCCCFENHSTKQKKTFFYRLEYCGHVYCRECIEMQLSSNIFPVVCAAENCGEQLVWKDFENLFKTKVKSRRELKSASLKSYVEKNPDRVHHCITPDCEMVYVVTKNSKRFICRRCRANICSKCHNTWHEGYMTCDTRTNVTELRGWLKEDPTNRKLCPNCNAPIEKNGGCKHVACRQCKKHICWPCLRFFGTSSECYDHLSLKHGGCF